jgi:hypothetical protein
MKTRWALAAAVATAAALLSSLLASAAPEPQNDGNDVKGQLDVKSVNRWGPPEKPGWSVSMRSRLGTHEMWDHGFFIVQLDTFGNERFDYYALVKSNGRGIKGTLWRDRQNKRDRKISSLPAWRSGSKMTVRVPFSKLDTGGKERDTYRWFVKTLFIGDNCRRVCIDRVPNNKNVTESNGKQSPASTEDSNAPAPSPTPDVTNSPGATPSPEEPETSAPTESPTESPTDSP